MNYYPVEEESQLPCDTYRKNLHNCNMDINRISKEPIDKCHPYAEQDSTLQELTKLNDDVGAVHEHGIQSIGPGLYSISNFHDCECKTPNTNRIANKHPTLTHRDGYGWTSTFGCNIDDDSKMRNAKNITNPRLIHQLNTRPYLTVPYMGRGSGNICVESVLNNSEDTGQKRSCNTMSGINIDRFVPLVKCLEGTIQNPENIVQEGASEDWVRGGVPSRQMLQDKIYLDKCGYNNNDGEFWSRK